MLSIDEGSIDGITERFYNLLRGRVPPPIEIPADMPDHELRQLATYINRFLAEYAPFARAMEAVSQNRTDCRQVTIGTRRNGEATVEITIEDSGPGLAGKDLDLICSPSYTTKPGRPGLGLPVSRSVVDQALYLLDFVLKPLYGRLNLGVAFEPSVIARSAYRQPTRRWSPRRRSVPFRDQTIRPFRSIRCRSRKRCRRRPAQEGRSLRLRKPQRAIEQFLDPLGAMGIHRSPPLRGCLALAAARPWPAASRNPPSAERRSTAPPSR